MDVFFDSNQSGVHVIQPILRQGQQDEFQFSEPVSFSNIQQSSYIQFIPDNEAIQRIKQQEFKIQQQLRQRGNTEYEEKKKRKQNGTKQYEQFMTNKHKETKERKQQNIVKQKHIIEKNCKLSEQAEWKKVAANVPLKQGQHKGNKDITRMRESIINKRNDLIN